MRLLLQWFNPIRWADADPVRLQSVLDVMLDEERHQKQFGNPSFSNVAPCTISDRSGLSISVIEDSLLVLSEMDHCYSIRRNDLEDLWTLTDQGKAAALASTILTDSGVKRFEFLSKTVSLAISLLALGVSIIALLQSA